MFLILWVDITQLALSFIALVVLVIYTNYTRQIAQQSVRQIEAMAQPALVAELDDHNINAISIRNIGTGAAINISWRLGKIQGTIQYLEPRASVPVLFPENNVLNRLERIHIGNDSPPITLTYDGMPGAGYESRSTINDMRDQFGTVFSHRKR